MADWSAPIASLGDATADNNGEHHEIANSTTEHDTSGAAPPAEAEDNAMFETQVKEAGWGSKVPIDYDILKQAGGDYAQWHAVSGVYEWKEEFGEVGPEVPQLEVQLYGGEHRMRQGTHIANLQFEVNVDGPNQYKPARSVSEPLISKHWLLSANLLIVPRRRPSPCHS